MFLLKWKLKLKLLLFDLLVITTPSPCLIITLCFIKPRQELYSVLPICYHNSFNCHKKLSGNYLYVFNSPNALLVTIEMSKTVA